jgi:hypothetical protein
MTTHDRPTLRPRGNRPVPYTLTPAATAALAAWPANRIEHEPRGGQRPCDGRGCKCTARWTDAATA